MSESARTVEPLETLRQFGQEKHVVVQAYILIQTEVGRSTSIVTEIAQIRA